MRLEDICEVRKMEKLELNMEVVEEDATAGFGKWEQSWDETMEVLKDGMEVEIEGKYVLKGTLRKVNFSEYPYESFYLVNVKNKKHYAFPDFRRGIAYPIEAVLWRWGLRVETLAKSVYYTKVAVKNKRCPLLLMFNFEAKEFSLVAPAIFDPDSAERKLDMSKVFGKGEELKERAKKFYEENKPENVEEFIEMVHESDMSMEEKYILVFLLGQAMAIGEFMQVVAMHQKKSDEDNGVMFR